MIVWRSTYEATLGRALNAESQIASLEDQVAWLRRQLEAEQAHRVEAATPKPLIKKAADPVLEAIALVSGDNAGRRKRLGALAAKMRRNKLSDEDIITKLTNWQSTDDEDSQAESMAS